MRANGRVSMVKQRTTLFVMRANIGEDAVVIEPAHLADFPRLLNVFWIDGPDLMVAVRERTDVVHVSI